MAHFEEDHHSCSNCNNDTFVPVELLRIDKRLGKTVYRDVKSLPLPEHLIEKEIIYKCSQCGTVLNV